MTRANKNVQEIGDYIAKDPVPTKGELERARKRIASDTSVVQVARNAVEVKL